MDVYQPIDKGRPDGLLDLQLARHVSRIGVPLGLNLQHVVVDFLAELRDVINAVQSCLIDLLDLREYLVVAPLLEHLELGMQADAWELLAAGAPCSLLQLPLDLLT